jgi:hypothetical protein
MTFSFGNYIYTIGGIEFNSTLNILSVSDKVEKYDTVNNTWTSMEPMPSVGTIGINFKKYGIAFGTGQVFTTGGKPYFYITSGVTQVHDNNILSIAEYSNRILRYDINLDKWEYSRGLYSNELPAYQRISPCSLLKDNNMIVFNGACGNEDSFEFPTDAFYIDLDNWEAIEVISGGTSFSTLPKPKYQTSCVKYEDTYYYIIGGMFPDSSSSDIIERIDISTTPFLYADLTPMSLAKSGCASICYSDRIYVIGGYTGGMSPGYINFIFDI